MGKNIKCELYRDSFQNRKKYNIPKARMNIEKAADKTSLSELIEEARKGRDNAK